MGKCGLGAFANEDLLLKIFCGFYVGQLEPKEALEKKDPHALRVQSDLFNPDISYIYNPTNYVSETFGFISAKNYRSMPTYFQHLPKLKELQTEYIFISGSIDNIARENLESVSIFYNHSLFPGFISKEEEKIVKGNIVGYSYGFRYWYQLGKTPDLFDKIGNVIPRTTYRRKNLYILELDSSNHKFTLPREQLLQILKEQQSYSVSVKGKDKNVRELTLSYEFLVRQAAIQNVCLPGIDYPLYTKVSSINEFKDPISPVITSEQKQNPGFVLRKAAADGHLKLVRELIENSSYQLDDIDCVAAKTKENPNPTERTALHRAAENGHKEIVLYLLAYGANPHAKDREGYTPIDIAKGGTAEIFQRAFQSFTNPSPFTQEINSEKIWSLGS